MVIIFYWTTLPTSAFHDMQRKPPGNEATFTNSNSKRIRSDLRKEWTSSESDSAHEKSKNAVSTHDHVVAIMLPMPWQQQELMRVGMCLFCGVNQYRFIACEKSHAGRITIHRHNVTLGARFLYHPVIM